MNLMSRILLALTLLSTVSAKALDVELQNPNPVIFNDDLVLDGDSPGQKILIDGPWTQQSFSIINEHPDHTLNLTSFNAQASCLNDPTNSEDVELFASFDVDETNINLPVGSAAFNTGDIYIHKLPVCPKGHLIFVEVHGELLDSYGEFVEWVSSGTAFIIRP